MSERDIGASTGEGESSEVGGGQRLRATPWKPGALPEFLPSPAGASRGLPEERVGRDEATLEVVKTVRGLAPDSLACWTLEELRERSQHWVEDVDDDGTEDVTAFLDWLGAIEDSLRRTHG